MTIRTEDSLLYLIGWKATKSEYKSVFVCLVLEQLELLNDETIFELSNCVVFPRIIYVGW